MFDPLNSTNVLAIVLFLLYNKKCTYLSHFKDVDPIL